MKALKGVLKFVLKPFIGVVVILLAIRFGPELLGLGNINWVSERFSETLREKNDLIVYEVEITGQETVTQDAWLIGTVQKVILPYTFSMDFTVDLSKATVTVEENTIVVRVPEPVASHPKLVVDEEKIQKDDWLYPLTPERYAEITTEVEEKFFQSAATNIAYQEAAWAMTVSNLEKLFQSATGDHQYEIQIIALNEYPS